MSIPNRIKAYAGRYALVDGVPFAMPVRAANAQAFMAGFFCDYQKAAALLPGIQLHPLRLWNGKAVFVVTVVNYLTTSIGKYIEYSLALAVTRGARPAPPMLPAAFMNTYHTGQFILDLPVSTEVSVKGGKGIWGMPKHRSSLDFTVGEQTISAQYEDMGEFAFRIEIERPKKTNFSLNLGSINYSHFRNMLMASCIYFNAKAAIRFGRKAKGSIYIGDQARTAFMRDLGLESKPFFTLFMPDAIGTLDDHFQCWFVTYPKPPAEVTPEGMESVLYLGLSEQWLPPPSITDYAHYKI
jgi:hypothetical protein